MSNPITVDVWSDIACPWCWVGKRRLDQVVEQRVVKQRVVKQQGVEQQREPDIAIRWHAFELNPQAPREAPESVDYAERLATKYGTDRAGAEEMIDRMVENGRTAGLELRFDRIRPSNTFDAHRLIAWAGEQNRATELKERLFSAYLHEGRAISDHEQLGELAGDVGLDPDAAREMLGSDRFEAEVRGDELTAGQLGIQGVPFFVFERRLAVSGAQPTEVLADAIARARAAPTD